jgi:uncharacterized membrane protein YheB (UPF0754 family)
MNKAYLTNLISCLCLGLGFFIRDPHVTALGSYALSGALTNHIAIHMLFEKVPGLYGSGVIQLRFEEFKSSIKSLMMNEFFTGEQVSKFIEQESDKHIDAFDLNELVGQLDLSVVYENLVAAIMASSLGGMLAMVGGRDVLDSVKPQFIEKLKASLSTEEMSEKIKSVLHEQLHQHGQINSAVIEDLIDRRLEELTPSAVKVMIQKIIHEHLGWLVVWGGVFGGLIGLIVSCMPSS